MKFDIPRQRRLDILGQTNRLNRIAAAQIGDVNEGRLIVHGVLARALDDDKLASTVQGLDAALQLALQARTQDAPAAALI